MATWNPNLTITRSEFADAVRQLTARCFTVRVHQDCLQYRGSNDWHRWTNFVGMEAV